MIDQQQLDRAQQLVTRLADRLERILDQLIYFEGAFAEDVMPVAEQAHDRPQDRPSGEEAKPEVPAQKAVAAKPADIRPGVGFIQFYLGDTDIREERKVQWRKVQPCVSYKGHYHEVLEGPGGRLYIAV